MRPIRLTISAFGPYAGTETVDFTPALEAGIFGIYGPTGAGKSSIFAAISFALFGKLPDAGQDAKTVRSDHAAPSLMTEVELLFDLGAKRYLIRRRPDQMRPAKRGDGETAEKHHAAFFDVTGLTIADIDAGQTGTVIAERKVSDVDPEIQSLLGYGPEQFRQIILLPQGEFETFLKAKTKDRMAVLRKLFDVSIYRRFTEMLKDRANTSEKDIKAGRAAVAARLAQEGHDTREALNEAILAEENLCDIASGQAKVAQTKSADALAQLTTARAAEALFIEQDEAMRALATLDARRDDFAILRERFTLLGAVAAVAPLHDALGSARGTLATATEHFDRVKHLLETANARHATSHEALKTIEQNSDKRALWQQDALRLEHHKSAVLEAAPLAEQMITAERTLKAAEADLAATTLAHGSAIETIETGQAALQQLRGRHDALRGLETDLRHAETEANAVDAFYAAEAKVQQITGQSSEAETNLAKAISETALADRAFSEAEMALAAVQAVHLASKLEDTSPCPVCGSTDHPMPATGNPESAGLNAAFERARDARTQVLVAEKTASDMATTAKAHLNTAIEQRDALPAPLAGFVDQRPVIKTQIKTLGPLGDIDVFAARIAQDQAKATNLSADLERARQAEQTARIEFATANTAYSSVLSKLPEDLNSIDKVTAAMMSVRAKIDEYDTELKSTQAHAQDDRDAAISAQKTRDLAEAAAHDAEGKTNAAHAAFVDGLSAAKLSKDQFDDAQKDIPKRDSLGRKITDFDTRCALAQTRVEQASANALEQTRPDIAAFVELHSTADAAARDALAAKTKQDARLAQLINLRTSVNADIATFARKEGEIAPLLAVAQASSGANPAKLTLETYAIAAMFDQVLISANLRLGPMSGGQYTLLRDTRAPKGNATQGLDIMVHDTHTGRERDVATLSGGETFMAALSLALGLADVVQTISGGIRLDTIFIDEGFGSLDATTLDQALQTLQDLVGDSRAIGLISHVDLVKDTIRAGFDITKSNGGSKIRARD